MATAKMLEFTIGLVIVVLVFFLIGGCVSKFLNPKCDLRAVDAFDSFNTLYTDCMAKNVNGVCKCGEFSFRELPPNYKILLTPFVKDNKEEIRVSLVCNGINAKNNYLGKNEDEMVRVYVADPASFKKVKDLSGNVIDLKGQYISEQILGNGFEIVGEETDFEYGTNYVKNVNSIFGFGDSLILVNYNGKVAFLATIPNQLGYLGKNPLNDCVKKII